MLEIPEEARLLVDKARSIVAFTGAGMSAESGLATYRSPKTGVWENVDPTAMASIDAWARDPLPMWQWYLDRREQAASAQPNAGHAALAPFPVITQNIDDLHERAGTKEVVHLHGSLFEFRCTICARPYRGQLTQELNECPLCGNLVRPGVVWFGEMLPSQPWARAEELIRNSDLLIVVGTSGVVQPAASLPQFVSQVLEISPESASITPISDLSWRTTAATGLAQLLQYRH